MAQLDDLYTALKNADAAGDAAGATKLAAYIKGLSAAPQALAAPPATTPSRMDQFSAGLKDFVGKNAVMGGVEHAANIGATIMQPFQALFDKPGANQATRAGIKSGVDELGVDRNSLGYKNAGLLTDLAGTSGVGGALGLGAKALGAAPKVVNALGSSGFTTGAEVAPNMLGRAGDLALRSGAGATTGAASTALINPNDAGTGAIVGGVLPPALKAVGSLAEPVGAAAANMTQAGARRLMQSALKPTIAQLRSGEAKTAVQTLLDYGINPTEKGVAKLKDLISGLNDQIASKVGASDATVSKQNVLNALSDTKQKFGNQVSPTADLNAIGGVEADFLNHPLAPGQDIPVQAAQKMKQGTYKVLAGKYGQLGSAETEAQKSLARGLKDEIATAVPGVGELNAEESRLLSTLSVAERRALMEANKNPGGLALLAHHPLGWAAFMADKSAAFKALAAHSLNALAPTASTDASALAPVLYRSAPRSIQNANQ